MAPYAFGGVSVPGGAWASILYAYQDLFILQYVHSGRENVLFCDGHVDSLQRQQLLGPVDAGANFTFRLFRRLK